MGQKKRDKKQQPRRGLGQKEKRFLHLKEFSQGRPNELSLNVLEQKAADLDEPPKRFTFWRKRSRERADGSAIPAALSKADSNSAMDVTGEDNHLKSGMGRFGKETVASRSLHAKSKGANGPSAQSKPSFLSAESHAEIAQRQKRRKRYRRFSIAIVIMVCFGLLGSGGYWLYQQQVKLSTSVGVLHEACDIIKRSDEVTVAIDAYFQTSFNDDTVSTAQGLLDSLPSVREDLESARVYAQKARDELEGSQRDKEAADHVLATIVSRETMLESAEQRLSDDIAAKQAIDSVEQAQDAINEGNALLAQAARVISDTTEEHVGESTEYTTSAKANFEEARELIETAQELYPSADFKVLSEYIDKKSQAAGEALSSNAAILIQDKATAEAHNDAYNEADKEASALAEDLPVDLEDLVIDAYAATQEPLMESYEKARSDAATHDAFLRDYLGTDQ